MASKRPHELRNVYGQVRTAAAPFDYVQVHNPFFFFRDVMHLMDCKGVSSIVFGSVLHGLARNPRLGSNIQERLRVINEHRRLWYSQHAGLVTLPVIKESNIGGVAGEWTSLHGPVFKAAITRNATSFFVSLARRYLAHGSPYEQTQFKICEDILFFFVRDHLALASLHDFGASQQSQHCKQ